MARIVSVSNLADEVKSQLNLYGKNVAEKVSKAVRDSAKLVKKEIEEHAPKRYGYYAKSWKIEYTGSSLGGVFATVYSWPHYRLTHLLEFGHVLRNGNRSRKFPHIAPAEAKGIKKLEDDIRNALTE